MKLVLSLQGIDRLTNGEPGRMVLDRHGAIIGRSPHADWCLPDPRAHVSSRHCEIDYRDGAYVLIDISTNGAFVNGAEQRISGAHTLKAGDVIAIGDYRVEVEIGGAGAKPDVAEPSSNLGWAWHDEPPVADPTVPPNPIDDWGSDGSNHASQGWSARAAVAGGWPAARQTHPVSPASAARSSDIADMAWSPAQPVAPLPTPPACDPGDVWSALGESNAVDWARGGFAGGSGSPTWGPATPALRSIEPEPKAEVVPDAAGGLAILLKAGGLSAEDVQRPAEEVLAAAGAALVRLVGGLVVMLEARTRAKAQLGAQGTMLELDGNNPLKFARSPPRALAQLLGVRQRGYMAADQAVEDAFKDLQAHQVATLAAMQGALRSTLDRFSPSAIRTRAESRGLLAKIIPGAREAELWRAYEREFEGVVKGSDEAFMDMFAKAFKEAYETAARR